LHLLFGCVAITYDRGFDLNCGILMNCQTPSRSSKNGYTPRLAELERTLRVSRKKNPLDAHTIRIIGIDHFLETAVNALETSRLPVNTRRDHRAMRQMDQ
jgi:hypothetical protein